MRLWRPQAAFLSAMSILTDYLELQRNASSGGGAQSASPRAEDALSGLGAPPPGGRGAMNRLIMNYLVTEGFKQAAEKFQEEAGLPPAGAAEMGDMDGRIRVREAVQAGRVSEAVALVQQMHPELLDDDRRLFFLLQQQQLIELVRGGQVEEALRFAADHLAERGEEDPAVLEELERTMALLAFEDPTASPFADLLSTSHRQKVRHLTLDNFTNDCH